MLNVQGVGRNPYYNTVQKKKTAFGNQEISAEDQQRMLIEVQKKLEKQAADSKNPAAKPVGFLANIFKLAAVFVGVAATSKIAIKTLSDTISNILPKKASEFIIKHQNKFATVMAVGSTGASALTMFGLSNKKTESTQATLDDIAKKEAEVDNSIQEKVNSKQGDISQDENINPTAEQTEPVSNVEPEAEVVEQTAEDTSEIENDYDYDYEAEEQEVEEEA